MGLAKKELEAIEAENERQRTKNCIRCGEAITEAEYEKYGGLCPDCVAEQEQMEREDRRSN